jgi:hypothetical protein
VKKPLSHSNHYLIVIEFIIFDATIPFSIPLAYIYTKHNHTYLTQNFYIQFPKFCYQCLLYSSITFKWPMSGGVAEWLTYSNGLWVTVWPDGWRVGLVILVVVVTFTVIGSRYGFESVSISLHSFQRNRRNKNTLTN